MPKGGKREGAGRKKGVANQLAEKYKHLIAESNPIEFLIEAFTKGYINEDLPLDGISPDKIEAIRVLTYKERCDIARDLSKKIVPDLKAIDHGQIEGEMTYIIKSAVPYAPNEQPKVTENTD